MKNSHITRKEMLAILNELIGAIRNGHEARLQAVCWVLHNDEELTKDAIELRLKDTWGNRHG